MSVSKRFALTCYALLVTLFAVFGTAVAGTEVGSFTAPLKQSWGGTGVDTSAATDGQILIGATSGHALALATITAGTGISVTNGTNSITITNTAGSSAHNLLSATHSDTVSHSVARGDVIVGNSTPAWAALAIGSSGKVLHSDGTDATWQTLVSGDIPNLPASKITSGQIALAQGGTNADNTSTSANTVFAGPNGSSGNASFRALVRQDIPNWSVTAKTSNYTVVAGDAGTLFTNTGAGGSVTFTLPTAAAGLMYGFYVDAAQTVQITAGASTTIQVGGSVSSSAGNISNNVTGGMVYLIAISSTKWVVAYATTAWTTA